MSTAPARPHEDLSRALMLISLLSEDVTRLAADTLGGGSTGNREVQVLLLIHSFPGLTPSALAKRTGMNGSSLSRTLRHLREDDLVSRRVHPRDRRSVRLYPTRQAEARIAAFEAEVGYYVVSHAQTWREIATLLAPDASGSPPLEPGSAPSAPVDLIDDLARAGAPYIDEVMTVAPAFGLGSGTDRAALMLIYHDRAVRPSTLSSALHLTTGGTTLLLRRLERADLVRRHRPDDAVDRRAVLVSCTSRGEEAATSILGVFGHHARRMGEAFGRAQQHAAALSSTA